jgi:hypothetical protein
MLAGSLQRLPAGGEHADVRCMLKYAVGDLRDLFHEVLATVQDKENPSGEQKLPQCPHGITRRS